MNSAFPCKAEGCESHDKPEGQEYFCTPHWMALPGDIRASISAQIRKRNLKELASLLDYATATLRGKGVQPAGDKDDSHDQDIYDRLKRIIQESLADDRDKDFIESLVNGRDRYGSWTAKQRPYAVKMANKYEPSSQDPLPGV